jgi:hypothetical protein
LNLAGFGTGTGASMHWSLNVLFYTSMDFLAMVSDYGTVEKRVLHSESQNDDAVNRQLPIAFHPT